MSNEYEYSQMGIDRYLNIYCKITHISMSNIFSQIGLRWSNSSLCSHQQDMSKTTRATLSTNSISTLYFFFLIWWWIRVWHSLVQKRHCNLNHCWANKKQLVKMVWCPAGILFNFYLGEVIWTWWAVTLLPGARMRGHLDQTEEGHPKSRTRGCQVGHLRFSCLLCLSLWDLVCIVGWWLTRHSSYWFNYFAPTFSLFMGWISSRVVLSARTADHLNPPVRTLSWVQ